MIGLYSRTGQSQALRTRQLKLLIPEVPEMKQRVRNRRSLRTHCRDSTNPRSLAYPTHSAQGETPSGHRLEPVQELGFAHFQPGTNAPCPIHSRFLRMGGRPPNPNRPSLNAVFGLVLRQDQQISPKK